jgi:hypothetical protein
MIRVARHNDCGPALDAGYAREIGDHHVTGFLPSENTVRLFFVARQKRLISQ